MTWRKSCDQYVQLDTELISLTESDGCPAPHRSIQSISDYRFIEGRVFVPATVGGEGAFPSFSWMLSDLLPADVTYQSSN